MGCSNKYELDRIEKLDVSGNIMVSDNKQNQDVTIESNVALSSDSISIDYNFHNQSNKDLFLFNAQYELVDGKPIINISKCYTLVQNQDLVFFKGILPIPKYVQVEIPDMPYARKIAPGEKISENFKISFPVIFNNPYEMIEKEEVAPILKSSIQLGYLFNDNEISKKYGKIELDGKIFYKFNYFDVINKQQVISSGQFTGKYYIVKKP